MKQANIGLRLAQAPRADARPAALTELLRGAALFLALDGLFVHATGLEAIAPLRWALLAAGLLCLLLRMIAKLVGKAGYFTPAALLLAAVCAIAGSSALRGGLALAQNALRDTLCAARGVLLPLADTGGAGAFQMGFTGAVLGVLLALLCVFFAPNGRLAALFCVLCGVLAAIFLAPDALWLTLCGACAAAFLCFAGRGADGARRISTAIFCAVSIALAFGIASLLDLQSLPASTRAALHAARYETAALQPEGDASRALTPADGRTILTVTADVPETLYLRGFVGDRYDGARWTPLSAADVAAEKDLFYWLHRSGFDAQSQYALARACMGADGENTVTVENAAACRAYRYEPFSVTQATNGVAEDRLVPSAVKTAGLRGEKAYTFTNAPGSAADVAALLEFLQTDSSAATVDYLQMESAYRDFVRTYALDVPDVFTAQYGEQLTRCEAGSAPASAVKFLQEVVGETAEDAYAYAAVQTLALRYYGVPARYVEGVLVPAELLRGGAAMRIPDTCATAWAEVYQDGAGWLPVDLTPGFAALSGRGTQGGAADESTQTSDSAAEAPIPEGAEQKDEPAQSQPDRLPQQTAAKITLLPLWLALAAVLLAALALLVRRMIVLRRRARQLAGLNDTDASAALYADSAALLEKLGLSRGRGSMQPLCAAASEQLGPDYSALLTEMTLVNARALFSSHGAGADARWQMQRLYDETLAAVKRRAGALKRLKMRWLECLY